MKYTGYTLLIIHLLLGVWAIGGFLEMMLDSVIWQAFTNPAFPELLLFFHWSSVLFASIVFSYGYLTHYAGTPFLMVIAYSLMALVCMIETLGHMTNSTKYLAMAAEYTSYILILFLLYKSTYFLNYFN